MITLLVIFIDPIRIALAVGAGFMCKSRANVFVAALLIGLLTEIVLSSIAAGRQFSIESMLCNVLAAGFWAYLTFSLRRRRALKKLNPSEGTEI
ncbi:hypothetical protein ACFQFS_08910 [Novosphingobium lubricantis]|jgi:dolichyl-phosphate-mannose--protein O-mannosyl transferase